MVGNNKFVAQFEYEKKKGMSVSSLSYVCEKEEVGEDVYETTYDLPKIGQDVLLSIDGNTVCEVYVKFGKGIYLYIFYCLCFVEAI